MDGFFATKCYMYMCRACMCVHLLGSRFQAVMKLLRPCTSVIELTGCL